MPKSNVKLAPALTPARSVIESLTDAMFLPMHGGQVATISVSNVTTGYPTILTLASPCAALAGQAIKLVNTVPTDYAGFHKILWVGGATVAIDLDSSALGPVTTLGYASFTHLIDATGNTGPHDIAGTLTNIWDNPTLGLTAAATGSWVAPITSSTLLELAGYADKLLVAFDVSVTAKATASELVLGVNRIDATGTNSKYGTLSVGCYGTNNRYGIFYRPETAADGGGTNSQAQIAASHDSGETHVAFIADFSGAAPVLRSYQNGVAVAAVTATMTNAIGHPSLANLGAGILCGLDATAAVTNKFGSGGSGGKIQNLLVQKSNESIATLVSRIRNLANLKEYRA